MKEEDGEILDCFFFAQITTKLVCFFLVQTLAGFSYIADVHWRPECGRRGGSRREENGAKKKKGARRDGLQEKKKKKKRAKKLRYLNGQVGCLAHSPDDRM